VKGPIVQRPRVLPSTSCHKQSFSKHLHHHYEQFTYKSYPSYYNCNIVLAIINKTTKFNTSFIRNTSTVPCCDDQALTHVVQVYVFVTIRTNTTCVALRSCVFFYTTISYAVSWVVVHRMTCYHMYILRKKRHGTCRFMVGLKYMANGLKEGF
jgi:hypothetical protein